MIFNPAIFLFFLLIIISIYYVIPLKLRNSWLLLISYFFCLTYNFQSLYVLIYSTIVSYLIGLLIDRLADSRFARKGTVICLWCGILLCIFPLIISKTDKNSFFVLIGISFYSLQEIGYIADIYYRKRKAEHNLINYAVFVAFFPKLVSGPIEKNGDFLSQIEKISMPAFDYDRVRDGFELILWGYFQKSVIADSFSVYVDKVYGQWESYSGATILLSTFLFAFQLYADFSGYTNIALGAAQVMGIRLQKNFSQPYLAVSIKDFWRRWHISLSLWLRDYIYIPLGGNQGGRVKKYINLMITFLVSGAWHGGSWSFFAWGMIHGFYQVVEDYIRSIRKKEGTSKGKDGQNIILTFIRRIRVFIMVDIAWFFFRASGLRAAFGMLYKVFLDFSGGNLATDIFETLNLNGSNISIGILLILLLITVDLLHENNIHIRILLNRQNIVLRWVCYMGMLLTLTFMGMRRCGIEASNFIYMQF